MPVAVKVDRILFIRGRHKLAVAHRARKRAFQRQRIVAFITRHQQEGFQLTGKIVGAARVVKGERRQRVDNTGFPHHAAPACLHADDPDHDFWRHAVNLPGAVKRILILVPERHAVLHVIRRNEFIAIAQPGAVWPRRRLSGRRLAVHQTQHVIEPFGL